MLKTGRNSVRVNLFNLIYESLKLLGVTPIKSPRNYFSFFFFYDFLFILLRESMSRGRGQQGGAEGEGKPTPR